jgi:hypothetical protein
LDYAAKYREQLLYNRYQSGRNTIKRYRDDPPYAYVIPQNQRDPQAPVELLRRLAFNGVRVMQLDQTLTHAGQTFTKGSWIIPMDQEFAEAVRELFEEQEYPDLRQFPDGPPDQPYDAAGWSLPLQMNVDVQIVSSPLTDAFRSSMRPLQGTATDWRNEPEAPFTTNEVAAGVALVDGTITGQGDELVVDPSQTNVFRLINRVLSQNGIVRVDAESGDPRYVIAGVRTALVDGWAKALGVHGLRRAATAATKALPVLRPRIGIFTRQGGSMDAGWTEWLLDRYEFSYTRITSRDILAGNLAERFDVLLFADAVPSVAPTIGAWPERYNMPGIGERGVQILNEFVRGGGTLVSFGSSASFIIEHLRLPVRIVVEGLSPREYFAPGSIVRAVVDTTHFVMAGMPKEAKLFVDHSPVFTTLDGFQGSVIAKYDVSGPLRLSGYVLGEKYQRGYAAAVDVEHGAGHVVLLGFRPQWRGQPMGTFRVVFNSALFSKDVASRTGGIPNFWSAPPKPSAKPETK